eukprot:gene8263-9112_t
MSHSLEHFQQAKQQVLDNLFHGLDFSPKGSIDPPIQELVNLINRQSRFVTTSSCSGRISVSHARSEGEKGVIWVLIRHGFVTAEEVAAALSQALQEQSAAHLVALLVEPFILHVSCASLSDARDLYRVAFDCGYRESGISLSDKKVLLAVRTLAFRLETPLAINGRALFSLDSLAAVVDEANERLAENFARVDRLLVAMKKHFDFPALSLSPSPPSTSRSESSTGSFPKHSKVVHCEISGRKVAVVSGGRVGMEAQDCLQGHSLQIHGNAPPPRWGHVFQFLGEGKFFLAGGRNKESILSDAYLLSLRLAEEGQLVADWTLLPFDEHAHFLRRCFAAHCLVCDQERKAVVISGGLTELDDLLPSSSFLAIHLDTLRIQSVSVIQAPCRFGHSLCTLPGKCLLVSGGAGPLDDSNRLLLFDFFWKGKASQRGDCDLVVLLRENFKTKSLPCEVCRVHHESYYDSGSSDSVVLVGGSVCALAFGQHNCLPAAFTLRSSDTEVAKDSNKNLSVCRKESSGYELVVSKKAVKTVKTFLEKEGLIDKHIKIHPLGVHESRGDVIIQKDDAFQPGELMAVPLLTQFAVELSALADGEVERTPKGKKEEEWGETFSFLKALPSSIWIRKCTQKEVKHSMKDKASEFLQRFVEQHNMPNSYFFSLPKKYEVVGDILMIPEESFQEAAWKKVLANIDGRDFWLPLARCFNLQRVALKKRIDSGPMRKSQVIMLYNDRTLLDGKTRCNCADNHDEDDGWVSVVENGIKFSFDICKVMFCSGNNTERMRMGKLMVPNETVVDLYAGIGYYTVPLLYHAKAGSLIACEWNPNSLRALRHNLTEAGVIDRCTIVPGDNQLISFESIADRVLLGLLPSSKKGWHLAVKVLKASGGIIHVHENVFEKELSQWLEELVVHFERLFLEANKQLSVKILHVERVKSYAPRVNHYVVDLACRHCFSDGEQL